MLCDVCGENNRKDAVCCNACGRKLCLPKTILAVQAETEPTIVKSRGRAVIWALVAMTLLFSAVSLAASPYGFGKNDGGEAHALDNPDNDISAGYPTLIPIMELKPTPEPERAEQTPLHIPTSAPSPIIKPTMRPDYALNPEPSATTPDPNAANYDREPIDALCSFVLGGGAQYARAAFPPEYLQYEIASYGFAVELMGGEDAAIEIIGEILVMQLESKYGEITNITYTVENRTVLSVQQLEELCATLTDYGMTVMPAEAHSLSIKMKISSLKGAFTQQIELRVILINREWYIHPADIGM